MDNKLRQLQRDLAYIGDENFELLTFELVRVECPRAKKLANPDGGADIVVPATNEGKPRVFQVKHYPEHISWPKCVASLEAALREHDPDHVTFCFPRDLSQPQHKRFEEKLANLRPEITIDYWGVSDFHTRLAASPEIAGRYFERVRNDALRAAQRSIGQGGRPLDTGLDIVQRASELARFADELDPDFRQQVASGATTDFQEPLGWAELPFMTLKISNDTDVVRLDFWPRAGVEVKPANWSFKDDENGRSALEVARTALARGEVAKVTDAIHVVLQQAPVVVSELAEEIKEAEVVGELTIQPGAPLPLTFEIETPEETVTRTIDVRPVLPRRSGCADFVGIEGALRVELEFELLDHPTIRLTSSFTASFGSSARENLEAAVVLDAFARNNKITLRAPNLLPDEGMVEAGARLTDAAAVGAAFFRRLSSEIVAIEQHVGFEIDVPDHLERKDLETVANVASWLRGEEGSATIGHIVLEFSPAELAKNLDGLANGDGEVKLPIEETIFGRVVPVGMIKMKLPPMKVIETRTASNDPQAPVKVRMVPAAADAARPFRLLAGGRLTRVLVPRPAIELPQPASVISVPKAGEAFGVVAPMKRPKP